MREKEGKYDLKGLPMRRERSLLAFLIFNEEFYSQLPLMTCLGFAWGSLTFLKGRSLMRKLLKKKGQRKTVKYNKPNAFHYARNSQSYAMKIKKKKLILIFIKYLWQVERESERGRV